MKRIWDNFASKWCHILSSGAHVAHTWTLPLPRMPARIHGPVGVRWIWSRGATLSHGRVAPLSQTWVVIHNVKWRKP